MRVGEQALEVSDMCSRGNARGQLESALLERDFRGLPAESVDAVDDQRGTAHAALIGDSQPTKVRAPLPTVRLGSLDVPFR